MGITDKFREEIKGVPLDTKVNVRMETLDTLLGMIEELEKRLDRLLEFKTKSEDLDKESISPFRSKIGVV